MRAEFPVINYYYDVNICLYGQVNMSCMIIQQVLLVLSGMMEMLVVNVVVKSIQKQPLKIGGMFIVAKYHQ